MKSYSLKFIVVFFLIIGLNYSGLFAISRTLAFYNNNESSDGNLFIAGVLDFTLDASEFHPIEPSISLEPGDITWKDIDVVPENDSNPFQYYVESADFSGDNDFCDALDVDAELEGTQVYSGDLYNLLTEATTTLDSWNFEFGMGVNNFQNKVCSFDIVYNGWQTRHDYPAYENGGYSDTERVSNTISSWGLRLNKVYYDVAPDRGEEGDNEWVEIFNQTSVPLDISGWEICDNTSCDVIPTVNPIPAMGYGVITGTSTTWGYWYVPNEIVKIVLPDGEIGNGLGNDGDALFLKRPDGTIIDQMNWQSNTDVWNPGAVDVAEGNVLARVPNGYDTDQPSDWVELMPPEVDLIYPDEEGSYTWYWTYSYEIQWTATNPNGDDADLAIDLYYIKDVNHDVEISEGDTKHNIVMGTANDGSYWWTVPSGFVGYIWIEFIATGPENPMLNSRTISGDIWDPMPIFLWEKDPEAVIEALLNPDDEGEGVVIDAEEIISDEEEVYPVAQPEADGIGEVIEEPIIEEEPVVEEEIIEEPAVEIVEEEITQEEPTVEEEVIIEEEPIIEIAEEPVEETATSTEEIIIEEVVEEEAATSTPEIIIEEEPIVEEEPAVEEEIIEEPIVEEEIIEEPIIEEEPAVEEEIIEEPIIEEEPAVEEEIIEELSVPEDE